MLVFLQLTDDDSGSDSLLVGEPKDGIFRQIAGSHKFRKVLRGHQEVGGPPIGLLLFIG
jgi:hypothetical protein